MKKFFTLSAAIVFGSCGIVNSLVAQEVRPAIGANDGYFVSAAEQTQNQTLTQNRIPGKLTGTTTSLDDVAQQGTPGNYGYHSDSCGQCCCGPSRYFSSFAGWNFLEDLEFEQNGQAAGTLETRDGYAFGFASGRYLNPCWRGELELAYRNNSIDDNNPPATFANSTSGRIENFALMTNVYRDFHVGQLTPYVGGGLGLSYVDLEAFVNGNEIYAHDWVFAYQFIAGASLRTGCRSSLFAEYRYFGTADFEATNATSGEVADSNYLAHNLLFGLRLTR